MTSLRSWTPRAAALMVLLLAACTPSSSLPDWDRDGSADIEDCAPADPAVRPGVPDDTVDGLDQDCSGVDGVDDDSDGYASLASGGLDCADGDAGIHPGLAELADDGVDQDCDGADLRCDADGDQWARADEACSVVAYLGVDCDDAAASCRDASSCVDADADGSAVCAGDCDDGDPTRRPGQPEVCDGFDGDCDGAPGADEVDLDTDGARLCDGDCDDGDDTTGPGVGERCDGRDNDCDGETPAGEADSDSDGDPACADCDDLDPNLQSLDEDADNVGLCDVPADCDDADGDRRPGFFDAVGDGLDENCDLVDGVDADGDGLASLGSGGSDCDDTNATCGTAPCTDGDLDAVRICDGDCDDVLPTAWPGATEVCDGADSDCDGTIPSNEVDVDGDGDPLCSDCDDDDGTLTGTDADADGFTTCPPAAGPPDCDDGSAARFPGAADLPSNGFDENCDGIDGVDADGDGLALYTTDCDDTSPACGLYLYCSDLDLDGVRVCEGDCDDGDSTIHPGAVELCEGADTDCDGVELPGDVDNDTDGDPFCSDCDDADAAMTTLDADGDSYETCPPAIGPPDCDDTAAARRPGAPDAPSNGYDENCDGVDGVDSDGDGLALYAADCDDTTPVCGDYLFCVDVDLDGERVCDGDCNDTNAAIHPGAAEGCDGADTDCDGVALPDDADGDGDGDPLCTDCDDGDAALTTLDADGDGETSCMSDCDDSDDVLYGLVDADFDGHSPCDGDCTDFNSNFHPGHIELCDTLDNDCDGLVPANEVDGDGDLFRQCQGDCDDSNALIFPLATDAGCDGLDSNCVVNAGELDADADGAMPCEGDCDDADPTRESLDNDGDGQSTCGTDCGDTDTQTFCLIDCDDGSVLTGTGFQEICDAIDNNCDGALPNVVLIGEIDDDADGWVECSPWVGTAPAILGGDDCQDGNANVSPGAPDVCDGLDTNCNGLADEAGDSDGDGFCLGDCDDTNAAIHPGRWSEGIWDNIDSDCDGTDFYRAQGSFGWTLQGQGDLAGAGTTNAIIGDINGDAIDDWVTVHNPTTGASLSLNHMIQVFLGRDNEDPAVGYWSPWTRLTDFRCPQGVGLRAMPDLNGDGAQDLAWSYGDGTGWCTAQGVTHLAIAYSDWLLSGSPASWSAIIESGSSTGLLTLAGGFDLSGDGLAELGIVVGQSSVTALDGATLPETGNLYLPSVDPSSHWTLQPLSGEVIPTWRGEVGDIDGDGAEDPYVLSVGPNGDTLSVLVFHSGQFPNPDTLAPADAFLTLDTGIYFQTPSRLAVVANGDWDGDGLTDLWIQNTDHVWTYFFPGSVLSLGGSVAAPAWTQRVFTEGPYNYRLSIADQQGDINGDGLLDLLACMPSDYILGQVYTAVGWLSPGACRIWSGETLASLAQPGWWNGDWLITGVGGMGLGVSPTAGGDITGDGIDDLIVGMANGPGLLGPTNGTRWGGVRVEVGRSGY